MIESVDRSVGRITTELDHLGLAGNTIVLLLSDNGGVYGTSSMEPLRGGKGMLYEGGIRVPFVVRWPGRVRPGGTNSEPVTGLDLYPTLMEIAGVEPPTNLKLDGKSLVPLLEEGPGFCRTAVFWHFPAYLPRSLPGKDLAGARDVWFRTRPCSAVRAGDWKLIEYFEDGVLELYNLREDIGEKNNLVTAKPEIKDRLLRLMRNWRQQIGAAVPATRNPNYQPTEK